MEVAAGVVLAEQAISTTIEGAAIGALALAKPTQPLKAYFTRFATTPDEKPVELLHVSRHSVNVINGRAYVFGGQLADDQAAGDEFHIFDLGIIPKPTYYYKCVPAVPTAHQSTVPAARYGHTATAIGRKIYVFGGRNNEGIIDDHGVWCFDTETMRWELLTSEDLNTPSSRYDCASDNHNTSIIICGGKSHSDSILQDIWIFHTINGKWSRGPDLDLMAPTMKPSVAIASDVLYVVDHTAKEETVLHSLDLTSALSTWQTLTFASETPHPRSRAGSSLLAIDTGMGRQYLLYMFGEDIREQKDDDIPSTATSRKLYNDMWTYQLQAPSKTAAAVKDSTNEALGLSSDRSTWAEVIVRPDEETSGTEGKSHPGPRAYFAATVLDSKKIVIWGGITAKGTTEGDGWIINLV